MGAGLQACGRICWTEPAGTSRQLETAASEPRKFEVASAEIPPAPSKEWAESRPKGTPVMDEGFICMGGKAPICPAPPPKLNSGPITLSTLQGSWVGSGGATISVVGTNVSMNCILLKAHRVELTDDGLVSSIGKLWQLQGWESDGSGIEFRCSSTKENMESAKSEIWSRKENGGSSEWNDKMKLLGYAGSSASPLTRGVEGCMPGTSGIEMPSGYSAKKDAEEVALLTALVIQWREPNIVKVVSKQVVPDFTNRSQTGIGVELMHYIATSMKEKGFLKRQGLDGHDIPVLVREPPGSEFRAEALEVWRKRVSEEEGFSPVRASDDEDLFTSLGNGHFFQALNLFACEWAVINANASFSRYTVDKDLLLAEALGEGVPSIILRHETPRPVRAKISALLNQKREFQWTLSEDGSVDTARMNEITDYVSQFEWLSKGMDAEQVNCLVRTHLGIRDSKRIMG